MPPNPTGRVIEHLRRTVLLRDEAAWTDGALLEQFLRKRDATAFAALVHRHAPMVWGVCRRMLPQDQDAEDAFQATFLVLVRRAASIRPRDQVGNWLHGVAQRVALSAHATLARRRSRERQVIAMPEAATASSDADDFHAVLDLELSRLPRRYRTAIVLCDLGGRTRKDAAQQLGIPEGTLSGHLSRGRALLAKRLARHGVGASAGVGATLLVEPVQAAPASLVSAVIEGAAPGTAAAISARTLTLVEGVNHAMFVSKLKKTVAIVAVIALLGTGATVGWFSQATRADDNGNEIAQAPAQAPKGKKPETPARPDGGDFLVFRLRNAEAAAVAKVLDELLGGKHAEGLRFVADPRSNSVLVRGTASQIGQVKELIQRLDEIDVNPSPPTKVPGSPREKGNQPADGRVETMLFPLKYARAQEMAATLQELHGGRGPEQLRIAADPGSNSIVVRVRVSQKELVEDVEALIRRLEVATQDRLRVETEEQRILEQGREKDRLRAVFEEQARTVAPTGLVTVRQAKRILKLAAGYATSAEGLGLAVLGTSSDGSAATKDQWDEALRANHLHIVYPQPRRFALNVDSGSPSDSPNTGVLAVSEILILMSADRDPSSILIRSGETYRSFAKLQPRVAQLLRELLKEVQQKAPASKDPGS
jgi:RNA polymerase sigma factor (sigma-70 family)